MVTLRHIPAAATRQRTRLRAAPALPALLLAAASLALALASPAAAKVVRFPLGPFGSAAQPSFASPSGLAVDQASHDLYVLSRGPEVQSVTVSATAGQFKLEFGHEKTADIAFNAPNREQPGSVQSALEALPSIGAENVSVLGGPGDATGSNPYRVQFDGSLAHTDLEQLSCENGTTPLSGGSGCSVATVQNGEPTQVSRWHADGTPAPFSALGSNAIDGAGPGEDQTPDNSLKGATYIAIDESGGATDGDIYVARERSHVLEVFAASGKYLGQLTGFKEGPSAEGPPKLFSADPTNSICAVTVDGAGDLYVGETTVSGGQAHLAIHKYHPAANPAANADNIANFAGSSLNTTACFLAAGAGPTTGFLFASGSETGDPGVFKLDATSGEKKYALLVKENVQIAAGVFEEKIFPLHFVESIAVDPSSGRVLAGTHLEGGEIFEYDASGPSAPLPSLTLRLASIPIALAADSASGDLYVARRFESNQIDTYGPAVIVPDVVTEAATELTGVSATLGGTISADNGPAAHCHFQYVTEAAYLTDKAIAGHDGFTGASSSPCQPEGPFSGATHNPVSATVSGLQPETFYRFRIVGENANGQSTGATEIFETLGAPQVKGGSASQVTTDSALISGEVNPRALPTEYAVQYVTQAQFEAGEYAQATTVSGATEPSGSVFAPVSVQIDGLTPATTYHFRLTAANDAGAAAPGADHTFTTYALEAPLPPCSNDVLRAGTGARLPDCRAYEQVSPVDKNGFPAAGTPNFNQAAADGHAAVFGARGALPAPGGITGSPTYVASRGPSGWTYANALPAATDPGYAATEFGRDPNLHASLSSLGSPAGQRFVLTDLADFSHQPLAIATTRNESRNVQFATEDPAHFIFQNDAALTPDAVDFSSSSDGSNLYDYDHGTLSLAGRVPAFPAISCNDETGPACLGPAAGSSAPDGATPQNISDDGTRVFFTAGATGRLYMRLEGTETVQINASQKTNGGGPGGIDSNGHKPASFLAATPDGHSVYFSSCEQLTDDSTAISTAADTCLTPAQGSDLYQYDTESGALTDLTVDPNPADPQRAGVQGILGASPDGAYVYFVANGVLAANPGAQGQSASPGDCRGTLNSGACNLYLAHGGALTFIARLGATAANNYFADSSNWVSFSSGTGGAPKSSRLTSSGALLFSSTHSLTGYDNTSPGCNPNVGSGVGPCQELYRFDPAADGGSGRLDCVSCNPTGASPVGQPFLNSDQKVGNGNLVSNKINVLPRNLSAAGDRVFFETRDKLLAADTNGVKDVYEWEATGSGSCHSSDQDGGCLYLLSTGTSPTPSYLDDASASGDDVFIYTVDQLVPQDTDQLTDLYDVRLDGGLASQHATSPPPCQSAEQCHLGATLAPPTLGAGSSVFAGPENPRPCPPGKVRRHGTCLKRPHHRRHRHRSHKKRAHGKRRGAK